jgi:hypothetical protein
MIDVRPLLDARLDADARAFLERAERELEERGSSHLPVLFPQLARKLGRHGLGGSRVLEGEMDVDLSAWRTCDAGGALLLERASTDGDLLLDLYLHGDLEERTIVLRSLALSEPSRETVRLLGEVQRTNTGVHVEAGALDSNLVVRTLDAGVGFQKGDFRRMVLKIAFLDLPVWRMFGALDRADEELSGMLIAYATEREAAGRSVWLDTYRFIGRAPTDGAVARLLGGLEHGSDPVRLAAAEGLNALAREDLAPFLRERLPREPRGEIVKLLEGTL